MEISPISWQNHSTCPRLDMSGLAWKFNNFSNFSDRQWKLFFWGLVNTCFANCSSGSVTESARYSTFFKIKFLLLFMIFFHLKVQTKFQFFHFWAAEEWKGGWDMNTKCQYLSSHPCQEYFCQIKNNTIICIVVLKRLESPSLDSQQDCWSCSDAHSLLSHRCQPEFQRCEKTCISLLIKDMIQMPLIFRSELSIKWYMIFIL